MCLTNLKGSRLIPKETPVRAYRVFRQYEDGTLGPIYQQLNSRFRVGRTYRARKKIIRIYSKGLSYQAGFHAYKTQKTAEMVGCCEALNAPRKVGVVVGEVLLYGPATDGSQYNWSAGRSHSAICADRMKVVKVIKELKPCNAHAV